MKKAGQGMTYGPSARGAVAPPLMGVSYCRTPTPAPFPSPDPSGLESHWLAIGLPADGTGDAHGARMAACPRYPTSPGKALHPSQGLCMFDPLPERHRNFTDRLKSSRLFVEEEGCIVRDRIHYTPTMRRSLASGDLSFVQVVLKLDP